MSKPEVRADRERPLDERPYEEDEVAEILACWTEADEGQADRP